jgi:hypothetical protein
MKKLALMKWSKKNVAKADDDQYFLRLIDDKDFDPILYVVDKKGEKVIQGAILYFSNNHKIFIVESDLDDKIPVRTGMFNEPLVYSLRELQAKSQANNPFAGILSSIQRN